MSKSEDRVKKQSPENQSIYYAWIEEFNRTHEKVSLPGYESAVTEFLEYNGKTSILDVKSETIEQFRDYRDLRPNRKHGKLIYLSNFLYFVSRKYITRWNFELDDLKVFLLRNDELKANTRNAKPLSAKQLIKLYNFFNENISDRKWLEVYIIFRLVYNFGLSKFDIARINSNTYNLQTGEFQKSRTSSQVFDEEIIYIFQKSGFFLPHNSTDVYNRLKEIEEILGENITQEIIKATKKQLVVRCPQCGRLVENDIDKFGYVQVDLLNLGSLILCKGCLENVL